MDRYIIDTTEEFCKHRKEYFKWIGPKPWQIKKRHLKTKHGNTNPVECLKDVCVA